MNEDKNKSVIRLVTVSLDEFKQDAAIEADMDPEKTDVVEYDLDESAGELKLYLDGEEQ